MPPTLPTALMVLAPNQLAVARALFESGAAIVLKNAQQIEGLFKGFDFANLSLQLRQMSDAAASLTSGIGSGHVTEIMRSINA